jgi:hypothetical protein
MFDTVQSIVKRFVILPQKVKGAGGEVWGQWVPAGYFHFSPLLLLMLGVQQADRLKFKCLFYVLCEKWKHLRIIRGSVCLSACFISDITQRFSNAFGAAGCLTPESQANFFLVRVCPESPPPPTYKRVESRSCQFFFLFQKRKVIVGEIGTWLKMWMSLGSGTCIRNIFL